jgi:hypothetical protein
MCTKTVYDEDWTEEDQREHEEGQQKAAERLDKYNKGVVTYDDLLEWFIK